MTRERAWLGQAGPLPPQGQRGLTSSTFRWAMRICFRLSLSIPYSYRPNAHSVRLAESLLSATVLGHSRLSASPGHTWAWQGRGEGSPTASGEPGSSSSLAVWTGVCLGEHPHNHPWTLTCTLSCMHTPRTHQGVEAQPPLRLGILLCHNLQQAARAPCCCCRHVCMAGSVGGTRGERRKKRWGERSTVNEEQRTVSPPPHTHAPPTHHARTHAPTPTHL